MFKNSTFSNAVVEMVANTLCKTEKRLEVLLTADVRARIMFFLQDNISFNPNTSTIETLLHEGLTQQDIASMIGTTRQTVATMLNKLRKDNIIDFTRKQITLKTA